MTGTSTVARSFPDIETGTPSRSDRTMRTSLYSYDIIHLILILFAIILHFSLPILVFLLFILFIVLLSLSHRLPFIPLHPPIIRNSCTPSYILQ